MIEAYLIQKLNRVNSIGNVFAKFPGTRPADPFTVIQKIDQGYMDHISACTISFVSYGATPYQAAARDQAVQDAVFALANKPQISRVGLGGGSSGEDSGNHLWTYESIFNFTYYKEDLQQ